LHAAVLEPHADVPAGMAIIAERFEQTRQHGGMTGVIDEVGHRYRSTTQPVVRARSCAGNTSAASCDRSKTRSTVGSILGIVALAEETRATRLGSLQSD
jgi:hypothetical protein